MFGRYLKSQLLVLLCGGLVGPIFLVVYFALDPVSREYVQWMLYVGLLVTVADVLVALALARSGAKSAAKAAALERHGVLTLAQITGMSETGTRINDQPLLRLGLLIAGPGFAFDKEDRVLASVTRMGNFTARKLVVLVDPATHEHLIDWDRSALVNGLVPARFTLAEDDQTYDLSGQAGPLMEILQILKAGNVPLKGMVDLRSDPELRQQIQDVVRRAADRPPADAAPEFTPPERSTAQRLEELQALRGTGAITDDEYAAKRQQIISEL
ncbi:SHOCT domain-containing protein [Nonomuraea sp. NPDC049695]|uniref:SHOCT domain-containing protein n=1 Tax=Nonomuraea sp. NPDC049695 TaxID=3154734 RepID=UPI00342A4D7F